MRQRRTVELVKVNVIGLQALQCFLAGLAYRFRAAVDQATGALVLIGGACTPGGEALGAFIRLADRYAAVFLPVTLAVAVLVVPAVAVLVVMSVSLSQPIQNAEHELEGRVVVHVGPAALQKASGLLPRRGRVEAQK